MKKHPFNAVVGAPTNEAIRTYAGLKFRWHNLEICMRLGVYRTGVWEKPDSFGGTPPPRPGCPYKEGSSVESIKASCAKLMIYYSAWTPFRDAWEAGDQDVTALSAQVSNLNQAEQTARAEGLRIPGKPTPAPDIEKASTELQRAKEADEAAKEIAKDVKKTVREEVGPFARDAGLEGVKFLWDTIPTELKIAGGVIATGVLAYTFYPAIRSFRRFFQ